MTDSVRVPLGVKEKQRSDDGDREDSGSRKRQRSLYRGVECVRKAPAVRKETVTDLRRRIACGSWKPTSTGLAEKILYEHLFDATAL